ncbi:MAG: adenylate/guanylate cyclase domain-containing protein [Saprospiraceae bacterium]|nr:adenylate/guanylate cyclase domain-containing protein [Saprospiraceae bacterium]
MSETRKLATILFADIAGYTALMQKDEQQALQYLNRFKEVLERETSAHQGQIVQYFGDGCLLSFESSTNAVNCSITLQNAFSAEPNVPVRIGIHMGEVLYKENNVYGDGVNIASRIESLGIPGSILMSRTVRNQVKNKIFCWFHSVGSTSKMSMNRLKSMHSPTRDLWCQNGKRCRANSKCQVLVRNGNG